MKIINWKALMLEPEGTVFQEYSFKNGLGDVQVFGGPNSDRPDNNDFVSASLLPRAIGLEVFGDEDKIRVMSKFNLEPTHDWFIISYPIGFGRDGLFETNRFFLVWETADRKKFAEWLLDPTKCAAEMNDDPHALISAERASTGEEL